MATQQKEGVTSLPAAADFRSLASGGYRFVTKNGSGAAALAGAGVRPFGLMDGDKVDAGEQTRIQKLGGKAGLKADAGGTIALNDPVGSDSTGRMVKITTAGQFVCGTADEAAVVGQVAGFSPCEPYALPA